MSVDYLCTATAADTLSVMTDDGWRHPHLWSDCELHHSAMLHSVLLSTKTVWPQNEMLNEILNQT